MNTEYIRSLLPDYISGLLNETERRLVEEALMLSPELCAEVEHLRTVFAVLPAERIRQQLQWESRNISAVLSEHLVPRRRRFFMHYRWWAVAVASIATAVVLTLALRPLGRTVERTSLETHGFSPQQRDERTATIASKSLDSPSNVASKTPKQSEHVRSSSKNTREESLVPDAVALATFPYEELDSQFVEQFVEVLSDVSYQ
ncbi:MAG: hypothetical protein N2663_00645 [Chlorobi bacterium]|nr:hypothetical protein [Chlorobiota bacterium]